MTGKLNVTDEHFRSKHITAVLEFEDDYSIYFEDVRIFGRIYLYDDLKVIDSKSRVSKLGSCEAYNLSHDIYYKDFISFSVDALKIKGLIFRVPLHMILIVLWLIINNIQISL